MAVSPYLGALLVPIGLPTRLWLGVSLLAWKLTTYAKQGAVSILSTLSLSPSKRTSGVATLEKRVERSPTAAMATSTPKPTQSGTCVAKTEDETDGAEPASVGTTGKPHNAAKRLDPLTQYIIVRADLPIGMLAAQVAHAAGAGSERHPPGVHVVVLEVPDEPELLRIAQRLKLSGVEHTVIVEIDAPYSQQAMSIGCALMTDRSAISCTSSLPLLGKGKSVVSSTAQEAA